MVPRAGAGGPGPAISNSHLPTFQTYSWDFLGDVDDELRPPHPGCCDEMILPSSTALTLLDSSSCTTCFCTP